MADAAKISAVVTLSVVPYYALVLVLLILGKWFFDLSYRQFRLDQQMVKKDNPALALVFGGYLLALTLALLSQLDDMGVDWQRNVLFLSAEGLVVLLLLRVSLLIQNRLVLYRFDLIKELIDNRNVAVGVVGACGLVANGLILAGALVGESTGANVIFRDMASYWGLGQVILILSALLYQWLTPYDFHRLIGPEKNLAAGLAMGGFILASGVLVQVGIRGSGSWSLAELTTTVVITVGGFVLLALSRWVVDVVFLPKEKIKDEIVKDRNPAVGLVVGIFYLVSALIYSAVLRSLVS